METDDELLQSQRPNVAYIFGQKLFEYCDSIPVFKSRAVMVHSLIHAFELTKSLNIINCNEASEDDIRLFHSEDYVHYLQKSKRISDGRPIDSETEEEDEFGLGFDCPILPSMWLMVKTFAGASLQAAQALVDGQVKLAVNWFGGWHHAQRDSASGFCYINDIVLAIQRLRRKFDRVLYVDLDVHHGDGVENAFLFTPKVMTVSLHLRESGFFPGTGGVADVGMGKGRFYTVNVPYRAGITDLQINYLLKSVLEAVSSSFEADAVVCQCGADALCGDPLGDTNVSRDGFLGCVKQLLRLNKPTLFLGGGGYCKENAARLWTAITFTLLDLPVPEEIPEHSFFPLYGPDFTMDVPAGLRKSENTQSHLDETISKIKENLSNIKANAQIVKEKL